MTTGLKRFIVCGGRDFTDTAYLYEKLNDLLKYDWNFVLVHGDCRGADKLSAQWGEAAGVIVEAHPADWDKHGKAAGMIRNQEMLNTGVDGVVAFDGGIGTSAMINIARRARVPVWDLRRNHLSFSQR